MTPRAVAHDTMSGRVASVMSTPTRFDPFAIAPQARTGGGYDAVAPFTVVANAAAAITAAIDLCDKDARPRSDIANPPRKR